MGNRCEACERADVVVRGAKCAMHEHATSPRIDRNALARADARRGPIGPVPYLLAGGDPAKLSRRERSLMRLRAARIKVIDESVGLSLLAWAAEREAKGYVVHVDTNGEWFGVAPLQKMMSKRDSYADPTHPFHDADAAERIFQKMKGAQ